MTESGAEMPFHIGPEVTPLVGRVRVALRLTQKSLAQRFQVSTRTAHRWEGGAAYPTVDQVQELARAVFPVDAQLAAELAQSAGTTLQALGLVATPKIIRAPEPPPPAPRPFPPIALMVDSILLAGLDAAEGSMTAPEMRQVVRNILRAAFSRARGLGLAIEEVDDALAPAPAGKGPARR
jgi:transcriptional regulator with XRE-family HTH domain